MKKLILPVFLLISFLFLPIFTTPVNAQPKNITCKEWMRIAVSGECRYYNLNTKEKNQIKDLEVYCFSKPAIITDQGSSYGFEINSRPPDYIAAFEWDKCGDGEEGVKSPAISDQETSELAMRDDELLDWIVNRFSENNVQMIGKGGQDLKLYDRRQLIKKDEPTAEIKRLEPGMITPADNPQRFETKEDSQIFVAVKSNITVSETDINNGTNDPFMRYILKVFKGEVEVKTELGKNETIEIETPNGTIKTKGTHYWVKYDPEKKQTTVGVYEGKVEVIPKSGGKQITVMPEDGKPGVALISQKLSVVKLAIVGIILVAVAGGLVLFLKKRAIRKIR